MSKSPVEYAEQTLGVHVPWAEAQAIMAENERDSSELQALKSTIRELKERISDREMEIAVEAPGRSDWPSGVQAQAKAVKTLVALDEQIQQWREALQEHLRHEGYLEAKTKHQQLVLNVLSARMTSLGGLLNFYAACKTTSHRSTS